VVEYLKDRHHIEIQLDVKALEDVGIGIDSPITRNLKDVTLHAALYQMLPPLELDYLVKDGMLIITAQEKARLQPEVRVYDLKKFADVSALVVETLRTMLPGSSPAAAASTSNVADAAEASNDDDLAATKYTTMGDLLIVRASLARHREIGDLLAALDVALHGEPKAPPAEPAANEKKASDVEQPAEGKNAPKKAASAKAAPAKAADKPKSANSRDPFAD
jgi:hypothetical protein